MTKLPATETPKLVGYYVCWLAHCDRPVILYLGAAVDAVAPAPYESASEPCPECGYRIDIIHEIRAQR